MNAAGDDVAAQQPDALRTVFISNSHRDDHWREQFFRRLQMRGARVLNDSLIKPGQDFSAALTEMYQASDVAVVLVSGNALNSQPMLEQELPQLRRLQRDRRLHIVPVLLSSSEWSRIDWLYDGMMLPRPLRPLDEIAAPELDKELDAIVDQIMGLQLRRSGDIGVHPPADGETVPLERWRSLPMTPLVEQLIERASSFAAPSNDITPAALLLALLELGLSTTTDSPSVLASGVDRASAMLAISSQLEEAKLQEQPRGMAAQTWDVLSDASRIAVLTSPDQTIHARHLVAALLLQSPPPMVEELNLRVADARTALLAYVRERVPEDEDAAWDQVFSGEAGSRPRVYLSGYEPDAPSGRQDMLGITPDVNAFATLIAATSVVPPLSIGLFGDWGSGKSFFMDQLQTTIANLAAKARKSEKPQHELPFYKRIVQVQFNAWHYADGNLWASLVEHIFDTLRGGDDPASLEAFRKNIIDQLGLDERQLNSALAEQDLAQKRLDTANSAVKEADEQIKKDTEKLAQLRAEDIRLDIGDVHEEDKTKIKSLLLRTGVAASTESGKDLVAALEVARATVERGGVILNWVRSGKNPRIQAILLAAILLAPLVVGALGWLAVRALSWPQDLSQVSVLFTGLATFAACAAGVVKRGSDWLGTWITGAEQIKQRVDQRVEERRAKGREEMAKLEQELEKSRSEYQLARQRAEEAALRVTERQAELQNATAGTLMARFIQDRVKSNDYRQYLGVLAIVRRDFEQLSNLMERFNAQLNRPPDGATAPETNVDANYVNRIVLYIDDLDRCPPRKVVEVLQAVHLLLAFPLFVVVVGVDARWVHRALGTAYGKMLTGEGGGATPEDYLEKVFQIPFWLEDTPNSARERMLHGLLGSSVRTLAPLPSGDAIVLTQDRPPLSPGSMADSNGSNGNGRPGTTTEGVLPEHTSEPSPEAIRLEQFELDYMLGLAPILRSPRSLKRFTNLYRLMRAGLSESAFFDFLNLQEYRLVQVLLALATGAPRLAPIVFEALLATQQYASVQAIIGELDRRDDVRTSADWPRVRACLSEARLAELDDDLRTWTKWLRRASRYTFTRGRTAPTEAAVVI